MAIFTHLLTMSPLLIVFLGGAIMALVRWQRHPTTSLLVLLACGLALMITPAAPAVSIWVSHTMSMRGGSMTNMSWIFSVIAIVSSVSHALVYVLLLGAAFCCRPARIAPPSDSTGM
jgi:hypothetical protein